MTRTATTLLVMAKAPVPGRVKTRLIPPCSPAQAAAIAETALTATLRHATAVRGARVVLALDGAPGPWLPRGVDVVAQSGGDLGDRLTHACAAQRGPIVVLGMDTPQVDAGALRAVVDALHAPGTDAVLGPTVDGGWWTLAVHEPDRALFAGVPMSTAVTGARQLHRLGDLGLRVRLARAEVDVDRFADARAVARRMPGSPFAAAVHAVEADVAVGVAG